MLLYCEVFGIIDVDVEVGLELSFRGPRRRIRLRPSFFPSLE